MDSIGRPGTLGKDQEAALYTAQGQHDRFLDYFSGPSPAGYDVAEDARQALERE